MWAYSWELKTNDGTSPVARFLPGYASSVFENSELVSAGGQAVDTLSIRRHPDLVDSRDAPSRLQREYLGIAGPLARHTDRTGRRLLVRFRASASWRSGLS